MKNISYRIDWVRFAEDCIGARKGRGLSQTEVGKVLGVSKSMVSRFERNVCFNTPEQFLIICWLYQFNPLDYLMLSEGAKKHGVLFDSLYAEVSNAKG